MATPILLINGQAGSGKDTVAALIKQYTKNTVCIAQADPMKRFAKMVFGFTEYQLWGPSEARNAPDERFDSPQMWAEAESALVYRSGAWIRDVLPQLNDEQQEAAYQALLKWFMNLRDTHADRQLTPRYTLQTLGTEWGRDFSRDMWVDYAIRTARTLLNGGYDYDRSTGLIKTEHGIPDFVVITDGRFVNELLIIKREGAVSINVVNPVDTDDAVKVEAAGVKGHRSESELKMIPQHFFDIILRNDKRQGLLTLENKIVKLVQHLKYEEQF